MDVESLPNQSEITTKCGESNGVTSAIEMATIQTWDLQCILASAASNSPLFPLCHVDTVKDRTYNLTPARIIIIAAPLLQRQDVPSGRHQSEDGTEAQPGPQGLRGPSEEHVSRGGWERRRVWCSLHCLLRQEGHRRLGDQKGEIGLIFIACF